MVEVKSYMHLGAARKRLSKENMLSYDEVLDFSNKLATELGWKIIDEAIQKSKLLKIGIIQFYIPLLHGVKQMFILY